MGMLSQELTRLASTSKLVKCSFALIIAVALFGELRTVFQGTDCFNANIVEDKPRFQRTTIPFVVETGTNSIAPGELPGYTGWARPEKTLARYFSVTSVQTNEEITKRAEGYEYVVHVKCTGHEDCSNGDRDDCPSLFFLRAYGPSVIPGTVKSRSYGSSCSYEFTFLFFDPGLYTIEAVLTVSNPPPMLAFPLGKHTEEPNYEGYLLPGFPLATKVVFGDDSNNEGKTNIRHATTQSKEKPLCKFEDLVETSPESAMKKARWKVTGKVNERDYWSKTMNSTLVSTSGYIKNVNSLGIRMEYLYVNDCRLIEESALDTNRRDKPMIAANDRCSSGPQEKIHIVYIGDSVLRVQKDMLQKILKGVPTDQVELTFLSLHGGYRKNQVMGPTNVVSFLQDLQTKTKNDKVVLLFNTGLHDIHRLCGEEFKDERPSYLDKDRLDSGSFSCLDEYRDLLQDFLDRVKKFPASLKVFQSTTAAWPKYGNYGIGWGQNGQGMALLSNFCQEVNEIAFDTLKDAKYSSSNIEIMDGYWITYSRPDNREVGDIGKKLSHPGQEVLSAMTRKWVMLILDRVCLPI